ILGGAVDRPRREHLRHHRQRQIRQAAIGDRLGVIRRECRPPDGRPRYFEVDRDLCELGADGLMRDDALSALDAHWHIVERRLVSGSTDAKVERLVKRTASLRSRLYQRTYEPLVGGNTAVSKGDRSLKAMAAGPARL